MCIFLAIHLQQHTVQGVRVQNSGQSPQSLKLSPGPQQQQQSPGGPQVVGVNNNNNSNQPNQGQRVMAPSIQQLHNLALEKEQLKKRAEEITRQVISIVIFKDFILSQEMDASKFLGYLN